MAKNKVYFVTCGMKGPFADFTESKWRLSQEAQKTNWFDDIFVYDRETIDNPNCRSLDGVGCGFWWWKASIILQAFEKIEPDSIVLYLDAGCSINEKGVNRFSEYVKMCAEGPGFLGFGGGSISDPVAGTSTVRIHTKRDLLILLNFDSEKYLDSSQIGSSAFFVKKNEFGIALIKEWQKVMKVNHCINSDISINEEYSGFYSHRHDQSVLDLLVKSRISVLDNYLLDLHELPVELDNHLEYPIIQGRINDSMIIKNNMGEYHKNSII
jgi:hypothetical protein